MAATPTAPMENIRAGYNPVVYQGPDLDMDDGDSPITAANTLKVHRPEDGAIYVPGGGSNTFHTLQDGYQHHGGRYVIVAKAAFILNYVLGEAPIDV